MIRREIMPGLVVEIDPEKFDVAGVPMKVEVESGDYAVLVDLRVKDIAYDEMKSVQNVITLRSK